MAQCISVLAAQAKNPRLNSWNPRAKLDLATCMPVAPGAGGGGQAEESLALTGC